MEFTRQEYWSGLPFHPPKDFPNPGIESAFFFCLLHWQADSLPLCHLSLLLTAVWGYSHFTDGETENQ